MSWAEVFKINKNMKKALNEQLRDMKFQPIRIITATGTFKPEKTGLYKVICVGAGGEGQASYNAGVASGGAGGVAIKTLRLVSTTSYNVTVSSTASFAYGTDALTATSGDDAFSAEGGDGGTASGGDFNYPGGNGDDSSGSRNIPHPGSVGVFISDLSVSKSTTRTVLGEVFDIPYGDSILGYGGGGSSVMIDNGSSNRGTAILLGQPAAVVIVPIEMEE